MSVLQGFDADVFVSASPSITVGASPVAFTDSGDHITYNITDATKKFFDKRQPVTVEQSPNGSSSWTTVPATQYAWRPCGAQLVFTPARVPATNNFIRINAGFYFNYSQLGDTNEWSLSQSVDIQDTTTFQSLSRLKTTTIKDASIKLHTFKPDDTFSKELGNLMAVILYMDKSVGTRYECYAWMEADAVKAAATSVIEQDVTLNVEESVYYYAL